MVDGQAGKGCQYRPVDRARYNRNYLRIFAYCNQTLCPKHRCCYRYQDKVGRNNVTWLPKQDDYSSCTFFAPAICQICQGKGWLRGWSNFRKKYLKTKCIICGGSGKLFPDKETKRQWIAQGMSDESN